MTTTPPDLNLGPLTTAFAAPPPCSSITVEAISNTSYLPWIYPRRFLSLASTCFPSGYPLGTAALTTTYGAYGFHDEHVFFSPGLCPSGWSNNTVPTTSSSSSGGELTAFCCEPGFSAATTNAVDGGSSSTFCASKVGVTTVTTVPYTGDGVQDGGTKTFTFSGDLIAAPAVWVRWHEGDFAASTTATTTGSRSGGGSSSTATPSKTSMAPASTSSTPAAATGGMTSKAKIGVGIGVPLAALILLSALLFFFLRRRERRRIRKGDISAPYRAEGGYIEKPLRGAPYRPAVDEAEEEDLGMRGGLRSVSGVGDSEIGGTEVGDEDGGRVLSERGPRMASVPAE
ncbi:uncharacterized protein LY89DRAFT_738838 [Mollisia scopiformis]|uniref:Uncharacterized protein n=1 Tax=Mollisia scopiformis TaxID=149040 RepID=A0A194WW80_MOLSC|nr:uncharacterized protein LY89DRAFT_738838 [Mollisia scopiformis]KUJ12221.1 hypothetical protein LY89DRAFT_738838 [Mollisia scopiformis]